MVTLSGPYTWCTTWQSQDMMPKSGKQQTGHFMQDLPITQDRPDCCGIYPVNPPTPHLTNNQHWLTHTAGQPSPGTTQGENNGNEENCRIISRLLNE